MKSWVSLTINDQIAELRLERPIDKNGRDSGNALDKRLIDDVKAAVDELLTMADVRALLITGHGASFSVGGDLAYFAARQGSMEAEFNHMIVSLNQTLQTLACLPIPVVVAAQGGVGGGALGLLWCADHVVAADNCKFATGFAELGLSGDGGNSWYLPRLIGLRRAKEMLLENRVVDAETALDWGLVNTVVPESKLFQTALEKTKRMATRSITSMARMKKLLLQSGSNSYQQQLDLELSCMLECASQADIKIGIPAFLASEKPKFVDTH